MHIQGKEKIGNHQNLFFKIFTNYNKKDSEFIVVQRSRRQLNEVIEVNITSNNAILIS